MRIKVPSRSSSAPQTIIIRERRGLGCGGVVGIVVALLIGVAVYAWYSDESRELDRRAAFERARREAVSQSRAAELAPQSAAPAPSNPPPSDPALPGWNISRHVDDMTDETTYFFTLDGLRVDDGFTEYIPRLVVRVTPKAASPSSVEYSQEVAVAIQGDAFHRGMQYATCRVDSSDPVSGNLQTSQSRDALFLPQSALASLDGSKTFMLRFDTTLGKTRTLKFNLSSFTISALESELRRRVLADRPKGVTIAR